MRVSYCGTTEKRGEKKLMVWLGGGNIVGVDAEKAMDRKLFRVLEWGGMEVK